MYASVVNFINPWWPLPFGAPHLRLPLLLTMMYGAESVGCRLSAVSCQPSQLIICACSLLADDLPSPTPNTAQRGRRPILCNKQDISSSDQCRPIDEFITDRNEINTKGRLAETFSFIYSESGCFPPSAAPASGHMFPSFGCYPPMN